tara:strand:- start:1436 stop:2680 length:1245 start_codon:yes stop_codon:yes gene_type:complete
MIIKFHENKSFFEGVCIEDLIKSQKTPFYLYSQQHIENTYKNLKNTLNSEIFYAVKANSNQSILKIMKNCGSGADVVSSGELKRSLEAGFDPSKIIYEGVGKSEEDIRYAIKKKIRFINVESLYEIKLINKIGKDINEIINIGIRLNPDIDGKTIDKITTGKKTDKFGISIDQISNNISEIKSYKHVNIKGISCHVGSQIQNLKIFRNVFTTMKKTADDFSSLGMNIEHIDLGGGFSINYDSDINELDIKGIGELVTEIFNRSNYKISFEPGRYLVAKSGIIITKILTCKENGGINFLIIDAGMQTLIRPAMYGALHRVEALNNFKNEKCNYTVAGPICESSDIIAKHILLPKQKINNYLLIHDVGAYGAVMASNYNSRGIPAEILVNRNKFFIIHQEEKISDIIKRDDIPDWL